MFDHIKRRPQYFPRFVCSNLAFGLFHININKKLKTRENESSTSRGGSFISRRSRMTTQFLISSFIVLQFCSTCHTHTHTHTPHTHKHTLILSLPQVLTHTRTFSPSLTHTHTHARTSTRILFQSLLFLSLLNVDAHLQLLKSRSEE